MAVTLRKNYSKIAAGQIKATLGWASILDQGFDFPENIAPQGGTATVEMWDTFTVYTPTIGTIQGNQASNTLVDLAVVIKGTNMVKNGAQKKAIEYNGEAMTGAAEQAGDALRMNMQDAVITGIVAAAPGLSITLPAGYVDFLIPAAATNPDMINNVVASLSRVVNRVKIRQGGSAKGIVILASEAAKSRLEAILLTPYRPPQLSANSDGDLFWSGIQIFMIDPPAGFGGAGNPTLFVLSGRGYALKYLEPYLVAPTPDGWFYRSDNHWAWDWEIPYAHGVAQVQFIAEIVNP